MVAPPGLNGTGFPAIAAGDSGKVAFAYLGDTGGDTWNGYISIMTDSFSEAPLITTVQVNEFGDPLSLEADWGTIDVEDLETSLISLWTIRKSLVRTFT